MKSSITKKFFGKRPCGRDSICDYNRQKQNDESKFEDMPEMESMRGKRGIWPSRRDGYSVIENFLRRSVGKPWDEVYGYLCRHADRRTMARVALDRLLSYRINFDVLIDDDGDECVLRFWSGDLIKISEISREIMYINRNGILSRHMPTNEASSVLDRHIKKPWKDKPFIYHDIYCRLLKVYNFEEPLDSDIVIRVKKDVQISNEDGIWYRIRFSKREIPWFYVANNELMRASRTVTDKKKKQLNKKELKRYNLKNEGNDV